MMQSGTHGNVPPTTPTIEVLEKFVTVVSVEFVVIVVMLADV